MNVRFLEGDIGHLESLEGEDVKDGEFDLITCASAFVLVEDGAEALKGWAKLLRKGGKVVFDALTEDGDVKSLVLERAAKKLDIMLYSRDQQDSEAKVRGLLTGRGWMIAGFLLLSLMRNRK
jgi:ubiquinone/menaquinone biosynthesis C-methylase UbiE